MIYGYARVSTVGQQRDGNSLEEQECRLKEHGATVIYHDAFTGTKVDRPQFNELLKTVQSGDTIIATKLDRISRSASQGIKLVDDLLDKGVSLHILNMGVMNNTPTGKLIRNIMFSFAEFERDMIVERTSEGKAIARQKEDYREGRKPVCVDKTEFESEYRLVESGKQTATFTMEKLGIKRNTFYRLVSDMKNHRGQWA